MKKIATILASLVMGATLSYAADAHQQRMSDMKLMANGFQLILDGFMYNNGTSIENGVNFINKAVDNIEHQKDLKKYLPEDTAYAYKFGEKSLRRIKEYSAEVLESFNAKDVDAAMESGMLLLRQCNSCHSRVRGW